MIRPHTVISFPLTPHHKNLNSAYPTIHINLFRLLIVVPSTPTSNGPLGSLCKNRCSVPGFFLNISPPSSCNESMTRRRMSLGPMDHGSALPCSSVLGVFCVDLERSILNQCGLRSLILYGSFSGQLKYCSTIYVEKLLPWGRWSYYLDVSCSTCADFDFYFLRSLGRMLTIFYFRALVKFVSEKMFSSEHKFFEVNPHLFFLVML